MKKTLIIFIFAFIAISCSNQEKDLNIFMKTYKEILITREAIQDSIEANNAVRKIIERNGYTLEEFKNEFFILAKDNKEFSLILDSLRKSFKLDINKLQDSIRKSQLEAKADSASNTNK